MSIVGTLIPWIEQRFCVDTGLPNAGGFVYTFETDGSTPKPTYTDVEAHVAHANPIHLDANGRPPSDIFLGDGGYTFQIQDVDHVPLYSVEDIGGGASAGAGLVATQTRETQQTQIGTVGGGEDTLGTVLLPANQLRADGDAIHLDACGQFANNANNKRLRCRFGSTTVFDTGGSFAPGAAGRGWHLRVTVVRRSSASQVSCAVADMKKGADDSWTTIATPSETMATTITLALTGEGTATNDLQLDWFRVTYEPAAV